MIEQVTTRPAAAQHLRDLARLRRVRDRMDREYAQPLDVEALARSVYMSAGHLSREFRLAYGESPYSYLMTRRIERAMALLRRGDLSVTEVCFAVGHRQNLALRNWRRTHLLGCLSDKAELAGIKVVLVNERGTSSTCPECYTSVPKPKGRRFACPHCGHRCHRDLVGAGTSPPGAADPRVHPHA